MGLKQRIDNFLQKHDQRILWTVSSSLVVSIAYSMGMFVWSLCIDTGRPARPRFLSGQ